MGQKNTVTQNEFTITLEALKLMSRHLADIFETGSKLSLKTSCKSQLKRQITNTLKYIELRIACWRIYKL